MFHPPPPPPTRPSPPLAHHLEVTPLFHQQCTVLIKRQLLLSRQGPVRYTPVQYEVCTAWFNYTRRDGTTNAETLQSQNGTKIRTVHDLACTVPPCCRLVVRVFRFYYDRRLRIRLKFVHNNHRLELSPKNQRASVNSSWLISRYIGGVLVNSFFI